MEEIVRLDAFQRGVVDFVASSGVLTGRVGDHGVVFVATTSGSERTRIARLTELAQRVSTWARRQFGVSLHFGTGGAPSERLLSRSYQTALAAAQVALFEGKEIVVTQPAGSRSTTSLWNMRRALGAFSTRTRARRGSLRPIPQGRHVRMRVPFGDRTRAYGARIRAPARNLARQGVLDEQSLASMREDLERSTMSARTLSEIFNHFRRAVANLAKAAQAPVPARHERSLERAFVHIEQHYTEPLRLPQVARIAGFTPSYFSKLFIQSERMPFSRYVVRLRVERAKRLLTTTRLNLTHMRASQVFLLQHTCAPLSEKPRARRPPSGAPDTPDPRHR